MGCVSLALEPQRMIRSVSSTSLYEEVPPPAPNTVARPTTLGACQVRLQLSMLLVPRARRANFCAAKLSSFVAFEQLKSPVIAPLPSARRKPAAARSSASSQLASRSAPSSRTSGRVSRLYRIPMPRSYAGSDDGAPLARRSADGLRPLLPQPLVDLGGVGVDPLLPGLVRVQVVARDPLGHGLLVGVRPAEPLQDSVSRRTAVCELLAEDLVQHDLVVRALVLRDAAAGLRVVLAALQPLRA